MIFTFMVLWSFVILGIVVWQSQTSGEKWHIVKTVVFGGVTAALTLLVLGLIVILF